MLKGKCALVTGSMGGIGGATARKLASLGCNVMIHGLASPEDGKARRDEIAAEFGVKTSFRGADLSKLSELDQLVAATVHELGPIDILVNNAVARGAGPVDEITDEVWNLALAVN